MTDEKFDVIFRGQIVKGKELDEVKVNLAKLFKSSVNAIEPLFSGEDTPIKKSLDYSTAMKYQTALKQAGALAFIKEVIIAQPKANFLMPEEKQSPENETINAPSSEQNIVPSNSTDSQPKSNLQSHEGSSGDGNEMTLAHAGIQIMPDKVYEKREVDTSDLSLARVGERIIPKKAPENHPQPSIEHLSLEPTK